MSNAEKTPLTLIGGLDTPPMQISASIDWFAVTMPYDTVLPQSPYFKHLDPRFEELTGMHGYNRGRKYVDGRILMWHETRQEMGRHWIFSGQTLNRLAEAGCVPAVLVKIMTDAGGKCSRIDLAVDCKNSDIDLKEIEKLIDRGEFDATSRKFSRVTGIGGNAGHTIYVGSRQSEHYGRLYDKAAETGTAGKWVRLESELKASKARNVAHQIAQDGQKAVVRLAVGCMRGLIDFKGYKAWNDALTREIQVVRAEPKGKVNTKKWLIDTCAPVLGRMLEQENSDELWFEFLERVQKEREEYAGRVSESA